MAFMVAHMRKTLEQMTRNPIEVAKTCIQYYTESFHHEISHNPTHKSDYPSEKPEKNPLSGYWSSKGSSNRPTFWSVDP